MASAEVIDLRDSTSDEETNLDPAVTTPPKDGNTRQGKGPVSNAQDGHEGVGTSVSRSRTDGAANRFVGPDSSMRSHGHNMPAFTGAPGPWGADTETVFSELSADSYYGSHSSPGDDFSKVSKVLPEGEVGESRDGRRDENPDRLRLGMLGDDGERRAGIDEAQDAPYPTATGSEVNSGQAGASERGAAAAAADGEGQFRGSWSGAIQAQQDRRKGEVAASFEKGDGRAVSDTADAGNGAIEALHEEESAARRRDDEGVSTTAAAGLDVDRAVQASHVDTLSGLGTNNSSAGSGQEIDRSSSGMGIGNRPEESSAVGNREESLHSLMDSLPPGFVQCPGCPNVYELVSNEEAARGGSGGVAIQELPKGATLSRRAAMRHSGRHRFRCPVCSTCFCGSCRVTPYHMGFDCESWKAHGTKLKCTFCGNLAEDVIVDDGNPRALPCCGDPDCRERALEGCSKKLPCGHACRGPGTSDCIPCMEPGCPSAEIDGDAEFCNVCWTESLLSAPCLKLECGHFVHASCGREQLQRGRPTARLTFGFMSCPVCRADKALALHPHLGKVEGIQEQLKLANEVEEMALQRLRADDLPPLPKSPMQGYLARMHRRHGFERYNRQPIIPRGLGRGARVGNDLPYPPHYPGINVQQAGRVLPAFPDRWPIGGPDKLPNLPGLGMDWGMPPFLPAPFMPPSPPLPPRPPQPRYGERRDVTTDASAPVSSARALGKIGFAGQIGADGRRAAAGGRSMMIAEAVGAPARMLEEGDARLRRWDNLVGAASRGGVADRGSGVAHPLSSREDGNYLDKRQARMIAGAESLERSGRADDNWGLSEDRVGDGVEDPEGVDHEPVAALRALKRLGMKAPRREVQERSVLGANPLPASDSDVPLYPESLNIGVQSRVRGRKGCRGKKHVHWSSGSSKKDRAYSPPQCDVDQARPQRHMFPWPIHSVLSKAPKDKKGGDNGDAGESSAAEGGEEGDCVAVSSDDEVIVLERRGGKSPASSQSPFLGKKRRIYYGSPSPLSPQLDLWELSRKWFPVDSPLLSPSPPMSMEGGQGAGSDEGASGVGAERHQQAVRKETQKDDRRDWVEGDASDGDLEAINADGKSRLKKVPFGSVSDGVEKQQQQKEEEKFKPLFVEPVSGPVGDPRLFGGEGDMGLAPAFRRDKNVGNRQPGAVAKAIVEASKLSAESDVERGFEAFYGGRDEPWDGRVDLAAEGMCSLRFYVSPASREGGAEGGLSAPRAGDQDESHCVDSVSFASKKASKVDGSDDLKKAETQAKKERAEMVKRALKKYSYYQCYSCRKPYFGGLVSCEPAAPVNGGGGEGADGDAAAAERAVEDVKPQELLCGKCSTGVGGADCPEHGQEFIEHKCYWCCRKVASYFCGGVMHFCDVCHLHGFAAKSKKCLGGKKCLFGGVHPPNARNGEDEFVLGCGVCRPKPEEGEGASSGS